MLLALGDGGFQFAQQKPIDAGDEVRGDVALDCQRLGFERRLRLDGLEREESCENNGDCFLSFHWLERLASLGEGAKRSSQEK